MCSVCYHIAGGQGKGVVGDAAYEVLVASLDWSSYEQVRNPALVTSDLFAEQAQLWRLLECELLFWKQEKLSDLLTRFCAKLDASCPYCSVHLVLFLTPDILYPVHHEALSGIERTIRQLEASQERFNFIESLRGEKWAPFQQRLLLSWMHSQPKVNCSSPRLMGP
jgi:hypothetical protein